MCSHSIKCFSLVRLVLCFENLCKYHISKIQYFVHLKGRANPLEKTQMLGKIEGRRRKGRQRMRWLDGITDGCEFEQAPGVGDGQGSLVCRRPWGHKESDMTE